MAYKGKQITIIGNNNWASTIAKVVGSNVVNLPKFEKTVTMYVEEEVINNDKLSDIINDQHENIKYLPGFKLPANVYAEPNLQDAIKDADILIFVLLPQFVESICAEIVSKVKPTAISLSLVKGFGKSDEGIKLISNIISCSLKIPCYILMGANLSQEIASEQSCEITLGCKDKKAANILKEMIQTEYLKVTVVEDEETVEVCGALKNIVGIATGFIDGLDLGDNTKAAVIRLGLMEVVKFIDTYYPGARLQTFFESCGVADLIVTSFGGRNRKCAEAYVRTGKSIKQIEEELFNGHCLEGPVTAANVNFMLKMKGMEDKFPIFTAVHKICTGQMLVRNFINVIKEHPEHIYIPKHIIF